MKIEMGESIILSWLRHAKNCQIVQLNWKPSINRWESFEDDRVETIINEIQDLYKKEYSLDIFKKNSSPMQILQQGEIDAFGIEVIGKEIISIYVVDVAFHENGLNYGSKEETAARVIKKMVRSGLTIMNYLKNERANIIFASPKINNATLQLIDNCISRLNQYFNEKKISFSFKIIANNDFKNKIMDVVLELSNSVADTSELFMRSIQMYKLFQNDNEIYKESKINIVKESKNINDKYDEIKIGALVQSTFENVKDLLTKEEILKLQNKEYCKNLLNIDYPLIKSKIENKSIKDQTYEDGYQRYYVTPYKIKNEEYFLTKEWYERHKEKYIEWLRLKTYNNQQ